VLALALVDEPFVVLEHAPNNIAAATTAVHTGSRFIAGITLPRDAVLLTAYSNGELDVGPAASAAGS